MYIRSDQEAKLDNSSSATNSDEDVDVPVLVIGAGPTGLLTAYMLSKLGVNSLILEKYSQRLAAPKAHALSPRSLEICRQYGLDTAAIRRIGTPRKDAYWVNFVTNLSGERIGVLPYERMDKEVLDCTPEMIHNIPQPDFEEFVSQSLRYDKNVEIKMGFAFVACEQDSGRVICSVKERASKMHHQISCRYVVACDGAKSAVRTSLGIDCEGEDGYETMMTIHFQANLRPVVNDRVGMLHWITDPACSGFIIAYDIGGNSVLISNFDSETNPAESWTDDLARETVKAAIGKDIPLQILSYRPWVLSRKIAKSYRSGSVFLVGDAAHSFPPTGGLGLNSGIADAHNLAWKLAAVLHGRASPNFLDSYERERRPIALINSVQSIKNGQKIFSFLKALGTAGIKNIEEARRNLVKNVHDPSKQDELAAEVDSQREHFDNLAIHIGYVYGNENPPPNASDFTPKFIVGARLPHAWIKPATDPDMESSLFNIARIDVSYVDGFSKTDMQARRFSTLDLVHPGTFTLIVSCRKLWLPVMKELSSDDPLSRINVDLFVVGENFVFAEENTEKLFQEGSQLFGRGGLLVRPDQHLLGIFESEKNNVKDLIRDFLKTSG